jgi:hypothetical protein
MRLHVLVAALAGLAAQQAYGTDCSRATTHVARYGIHETPSDPNSPLAFLVSLSLTASAGDCTETGWSITEIEVRQVGANGGSDRVWTERYPYVPTTDGLWWVSHADVASPQASEFALPPQLMGTAMAADSSYADLDYGFVGVAYASPIAPELPPYAVTGAATFEFQVEGDPTPIGDGDGEPTDGDPPIHN